MSEWKYFQLDEFACRCGCGENLIDHDLVSRLDQVRGECGFAFVISSGYRCPEYNNRIATTGLDGPHTTGQAVDIATSGERVRIILRHALSSKYSFFGIGLKQKGDYSRRFIHLDTLTSEQHSPRPHVWTY